MIVPDPAAEVRVDFGDGSAIEHFFLGDICNTDGSAWECCPRNFLRRAVRQLEEVASLRVIAAFEQEFLYTGSPIVRATPMPSPPSAAKARLAKLSLLRCGRPGWSRTPFSPNTVRASSK